MTETQKRFKAFVEVVEVASNNYLDPEDNLSQSEWFDKYSRLSTLFEDIKTSLIFERSMRHPFKKGSA